jgi:hypothetical protein
VNTKVSIDFDIYISFNVNTTVNIDYDINFNIYILFKVTVEINYDIYQFYLKIFKIYTKKPQNQFLPIKNPNPIFRYYITPKNFITSNT